MLVRTFQAPDMPEALRMVRAEFGMDALVLNSRKNRRKGIMGLFSKPFVEVTAALAPQQVTTAIARQPAAEEGVSTSEAFQKSMLAPIARELKELREQVEKLSRKGDEVRTAHGVPPERWRKDPELLPAADISFPLVSGEDKLGKFKQLLLDTMESREKREKSAVPDPPAESGDSAIEKTPAENAILKVIAGELGTAGLADELVSKLIESLRPLAEQGTGREELDGRLVRALSKMIKCTARLQKGRQGPRVVALVGPSGVGKTTAAVKLASLYSGRKRASVALVSDDKCNCAALAGLSNRSGLDGVPVVTLADLKELEKTLGEHSDKDLIVIDTVGRSHNDMKKLLELKALFESDLNVEILLCVSATTREQELRKIISRYSVLPIGSLVFTRIDECETFGCIANAHFQSRIPISYLSKGERLPAAIEVASGKMLAELVLSRAVEHI